MKNAKFILGIETSCDDTSIAIIKGREGEFPEILSHKLFSQETLLKKWGGVVPEIAARNHLQKIAPLLEEVFTESKISPKELSGIAVTVVPGLLGPLLTGLNAAKTLALLNELPISPVNHLYAHLEGIHLTEKISYPYLGLLVSGGHSIYFLVKSNQEFIVLGSTIDDAAGEAFDKGGKLMGLGYPAGKIIDDMAKLGDANRFSFPIGLEGIKEPNLSFSGIKTALKIFLEKNPTMKDDLKNFHEHGKGTKDIYDLAASYQNAIIKALSKKLKLAIKKAVNNYQVDAQELPIIVGGGVACNSALRQALSSNFKNVHFVQPRFCTDNGAMIANFGLRNLEQAIEFPDCLNLDARGKFINKKDYIKIRK